MTLLTTTPLPSLTSREWAESFQALGPSDILWVDEALMGYEPTAQALNEALRGLPEHMRVVFDGASDEGVLGNLPFDNVLVSPRVGNHTTSREHFGVDSSLARYNDRSEHQTTALCLLSKRYIVLRNADNEALFVRPTLDNARILFPSFTRVPGPPFSPTVRAERMVDVYSGALAACLALGINAERGVLLANCATALGALISLSARDAIETAATGLKSRDQAWQGETRMGLRLPYALGALVDLTRADATHSATPEVPNRPVGAVVTSAIAVATRLMKTPDGLCSIRSGRWSTPTASADVRLLCVILVGIALPTVDFEAFAETVWFACGCMNRNEFQSTALLAAAVSIGINTQRRSHIDTLWDAVDVVSAASPHGEEDGGADVLEVAQRTLKAAANTQSDLRSSSTPVLQETLSDCTSSSRIAPLIFFLAASPQGADKASKCFALSGSSALCEAVAETLSGVFIPSEVLSDLDLTQYSEDVHVDWLGIAGQLLELYPPAPIDWIR